VEAASVELVESGSRVFSDALGRYRFRSVSPGHHTLRVSRVGYHERTLAVELAAGRAREVDVQMAAAPVALAGVSVAVETEPAGGVLLARERIEASGARSAAELLQSVPGVVVRAPTPGGPATASVRGGAADALLVLVDGMPLNDPVSGEADLSTVPAASIESVVVLPGGQSARYGPRAEAGVILIETRLDAAARELRGSVGSLGARSVAALWGGARPLPWSAGGEWSALDGTFDFDLPDETGGGRRTRENADARTASFWAGVVAPAGGGTFRLRGSADGSRRGLPGRGYAPARSARQQVERLQGTASWQRASGKTSIRLALAGALHEVRFRDRDPPFGLAYDDSARVSSLELRAEAERRGTGDALAYGGGVEARRQRVEVSSLNASAPGERTDLGVFGHASYQAAVAGESFLLSAQLRADRDEQTGWTWSRSVTLGSTTVLGLQTHVSVRSSYSPPALSDQHFRDAVGVEPNPDLAAERVPWEVEAGVAAERTLGPLRVGFGLTAYRADVRGMIVWTPDYRFVWSPRNVDVERTGAEARATVETAGGALGLELAHSYARVVYQRPPPDDDVQVIYRPRHSALAELSARTGPWRAQLLARFTGVRHPVAAPVNALPSFWTTSAGLARDLRVGGWTVTPSLHVERLLGETASLIFGFPEPGRTLRLDVTLKPHALPLP
jgi:outer membrane cobalamin receptor